ncbi:hypothetical protein AX17_001035 [Amanita inopinata Kibby_2008]|nr:hypothetical protein AX17_001035 [Amanita inopinata Kibby_2008]
MRLFVALLPWTVFGAVTPFSDDRVHIARERLSNKWYHDGAHPAYSLFPREPHAATDYAPVGSPAWSSGFPKSSLDMSQVPRRWIDALNAATTAGKIPNIPISTNTPGTNPVYPLGTNPNSQDICSATYKCQHVEDIWDAPDGVFASSFDDGPQPVTSSFISLLLNLMVMTQYTPKLVDFLESNNVKTTHFLIGVNILNYPKEFISAFDKGHDMAVHTWTHPYMTTLSNEQIVAELGWTIQLIHNSTGGRLPRLWRPPYGDSDNRVRAIAKEVFGLSTVIWNHDTRDWSLTTGGTTSQIIHSSMQKWTASSKTPGLIVLEHETSNLSVDVFMDAFPMILANGWNFNSLAQVTGGSAVVDSSHNPGSESPLNTTDTSPSFSSNTPVSVPSQSSNSYTAFNSAAHRQAKSKAMLLNAPLIIGLALML